MKIGLNATCLNDRPSGAKQRFVGIYGELIKRLPEIEFVIYNPVDCCVSDWFAGAANVSSRQTPLPSDGRVRKFINGINYWPKALPNEKFGLFEGFNQPLIRSPSGLTLLTIHDVRRIHPVWSSWEREVYKLALRNALRQSDHVITVSESMKEEIHDFYPGVPITVIYNGLDARKFDTVLQSDLDAVRQKYTLPQEFLLAVGHHERRKNYFRLIDALALLRDRGRISNLVIVGNDSGERKLIEEHVRLLNLCGQVTILSGLTDLEVRCTYKLCSLFIFPSSYEGFGIPILEAMAAERPMVLSDIPVFREITQGMGVYFNYNDHEAMALSIDKVLSSSSEQARLVAYGKERVQAFSFESLACQLEGLYRKLTL